MKKKKKIIAGKKERLFWTCARPEGSFVPNKKAYSRKRDKQNFKKDQPID